MPVHPLTPDRWAHLEALFGANGACGGCWCMWWRVTAKEFEAGSAANRERMQAIVADGDRPPGLLAYEDGRPVGWVTVAPREEFGRIERSRDLALLDGPVWSVPCFYVAAGQRGRGVASTLLDAVVRFAARHGARTVEGYAVDPTRRRFTNSEAYTGTVSLFEAAGFTPAAQRTPSSRIVMRRDVSTARRRAR
ncbi:MAG TPA: GNAT family N-acetyltransferase [Acidimicrobiales bacterium]|nr:GNAT family N-acetyltransferase [Acidimicrobiales bacterium]